MIRKSAFVLIAAASFCCSIAAGISQNEKARAIDQARAMLQKECLYHIDYSSKPSANKVTSVAASPDGKLCASSLDDEIVLYELDSGKELKRFRGFTGVVHAIRFTSDSNYLLSGHGVKSWNAGDVSVRVWEISTSKVIARHTDRDDFLSIAPTFDNKYIVTGHRYDKLYLWDFMKGQGKLLQPGKGIFNVAVAVSPDGRFILSGSRYDELRLWEIESNKLIRDFSGHTKNINSVLFLPDAARFVSAADDATIRVWDTNSGKELALLRGHVGPVHSISISNDGRYLVSGGADKTIRLWDLLNANKEIRNFVGHKDAVNSVAITGDGRFIISGSADKSLRIWDTTDVYAQAQLTLRNSGISENEASKILGDLCFETGRYAKSVAYYELCNDRDGILKVAENHLSITELDKAAELFRKSSAPEGLRKVAEAHVLNKSYVSAAMLYSETNDKLKASEYYKKAADEQFEALAYDDAAEFYRQAGDKDGFNKVAGGGVFFREIALYDEYDRVAEKRLMNSSWICVLTKKYAYNAYNGLQIDNVDIWDAAKRQKLHTISYSLGKTVADSIRWLCFDTKGNIIYVNGKPKFVDQYLGDQESTTKYKVDGSFVIGAITTIYPGKSAAKVTGIPTCYFVW